MDWTIAAIVEAASGRLIQKGKNPDDSVGAICTDTRVIKTGDCFVALRGERFDGHDFILDAVAKGAKAVILDSSTIALSFPETVAVIEVPDTLYGLGELARYYRRKHSASVLGITGSNGKTSTKEMIAAILSQRKHTLKNKGNFNNLIGVPLTLLTLEPQHEIAVVEMGINVPGEMERLVEIAEPSVGLITNVHPAHLEGLHSIEGILEEKGKLWSTLQPQALAVVNRDDENLFHLSKRIKAQTITYSLTDYSAEVHKVGEIVTRGQESVFGLSLGKETISVRIRSLGAHHVQNAVAAAAVAYGMGEAPETIAQGLSSYEPVSQRMQVHRLKDGTSIIDDTYNANPMSVMAAVQTLFLVNENSPSEDKDTKRVAILGEMRELGNQSAFLHYELGEKVARLGIDELITLGDLALEINKGAQKAGMKSLACYHASSHEDAMAHLRNNWPAGACILVKGSRGMTMERIVEGILD